MVGWGCLDVGLGLGIVGMPAWRIPGGVGGRGGMVVVGGFVRWRRWWSGWIGWVGAFF